MTQLHVAMIGQRGVPATFGGIERHVEEIGARLVERGHRVDVYCRPDYSDDLPATHRGMKLIEVAAVATQHLEAFSHSAAATAVALRSEANIFHFHAIGPGLWSFMPRILKRKGAVIQTIHGLDFDRAKWSPPAQKALRAAARISSRFPDRTVVVSEALKAEYAERYDREVVYIPNGVVEPTVLPPGPVLERFGLEERGYGLFVGRLVPEKAVAPLISEFLNTSDGHKLVIAGGSSYTCEYVEELTKLAGNDDRIVMTDYIYGDELSELYSNASFFALPSLLEGLPLTLLEAMSYKLPIVASDIPAHTQVLGESAPGRRTFASGDWSDLGLQLKTVLSDLDAEREAAASDSDLLEPYDWDAVTVALEQSYLQALGGSRGS